MLKKVCTDSQIEPAPQEMNGEVLTPGTNRAADARLNSHARGFWELQGQWWIQGRGPRGPGPPLFFDHNEAPPPQGLDPPLKTLLFSTLGFVTRMQSLIKASPQNKSTASMRVRRRECMPAGC